jgi:hypothetical protein
MKSHSNKDFIDFSEHSKSGTIKLFFNILEGKSIIIEGSNKKQIFDALNFIEFNSVSIHSLIEHLPFNFISNNINQLTSFPLDSIRRIISSHFLGLLNENQLFEFVNNLVKEKRDCLRLLNEFIFHLFIIMTQLI